MLSFTQRLAVLFSFFPSLKKEQAHESLAKVIATVENKPECYKSASNLDKCINELIATKNYEIKYVITTPKTEEASRLVNKYNLISTDMKKAALVGDVYPKYNNYETVLLVYNNEQGAEIFREKIKFLKELHRRGYSFQEVVIIVDTTDKLYSLDELMIINNKKSYLNLSKYPIPKKQFVPKNNKEVIDFLINEADLEESIRDRIVFIANSEDLTNLIVDWVNAKQRNKVIDIQVNPMIGYYKYKWNKYTNYKSSKIEVVGSAGVTNKTNQLDLIKISELLLSNIGLYFYSYNKYRF
ncbi:MAG: hypothetical protein H6845_02765 [Alphaproteobacteria bacterium]|nr:MAG: hypothetical protein H6845_02765 [Alphaproteobacteria bacterium]